MEYSKGIYNISNLDFKYPDMWYCESVFDTNNHLTVTINIVTVDQSIYNFEINFGKSIYCQIVEESWFDLVDVTVGRWKNVDSNYLLFEVENSELVKDLTNSELVASSLHHYVITTTNWCLDIISCQPVSDIRTL